MAEVRLRQSKPSLIFTADLSGGVKWPLRLRKPVNKGFLSIDKHLKERNIARQIGGPCKLGRSQSESGVDCVKR